MKQICPECLKSVEVPDSAAGTDFPCPVCGAKIPVPAKYTPSVAVPPPPPPVVVERPAPPPGLNLPTIPPAASSAPPSFAPAGGHEAGVTLSPGVMEWIVPAGLTLAFVLTFFAWVGAYPGGHPLFYQTAWSAAGGGINPNLVPAELEDTEKKLAALTRTDVVMVFYLILLPVAVLLAWAEKVVHDINPAGLPGPLGWVPKVWPLRFQLLAALAALLLVLLLVPTVRGFGLENAVRQYAVEKYEADAAAADTAAKKVAVQVKVGGEQARFAVQTTTWFALALLAHIAVVAAVLIRVWLARRPGRPYPRLGLRY